MKPGTFISSAAAAWSLLKRFWWSIPIVALTVALVITRSTLASTKTDLALTIASYENFQARVSAGTAQAKADDALHALDVQTQHTTLNQEVTHAYQDKLTDLGKRYDALRVQLAAEADSSGGGGSAMSGAVAGPRCALTASQEDGLLEILRDAEAETLKLVALQQAASEQAEVK